MDQRKLWDEQANTYAARHQDDPVYMSCVSVAASHVPLSTNVADAGCGVGLALPYLLSRASQIYAFDFSPQSVEHVRQWVAATKSSGVETQVDDLLSIKKEPDHFDAVFCANAINVFRPDEQRRVIAELTRILKPRGVLIVSVHHFNRVKRRLGWIKEGKPGQPGIDYIFRFTRRELAELLPGASITAVGFYGLARIPYFGSRIQDLVAKVIGKQLAWLGYGHMIVATWRK